MSFKFLDFNNDCFFINDPLKKNKGVGYARNLGARIARNKILCYIDSDIIISENSILYLVKKLHQDKNIGSVGAIPEVHNLNSKSWGIKFIGINMKIKIMYM